MPDRDRWSGLMVARLVGATECGVHMDPNPTSVTAPASRAQPTPSPDTDNTTAMGDGDQLDLRPPACAA
ncbi:hypothetical protein [Streptomyces fuscichromogenes]|nr:hypothetical protein [Streptomyces fuscichromogenes]